MAWSPPNWYSATYHSSIYNLIDLDEDLQLAANSGTLNEVLNLLEAGASTEFKNRKGYTSLDLAVIRYAAIFHYMLVNGLLRWEEATKRTDIWVADIIVSLLRSGAKLSKYRLKEASVEKLALGK